jgi:ribosomal protein S18 acetylase RimI-like enzyme
MPGELSPVRFTDQDASSVAGFNCGNAPWAVAIAQWITGSRVIESMQKGTDVWRYYDDADTLIGIGAVGRSRRPYPPTANASRNDYRDVSIIPAIGVDINHQRQGYGSRILEDLIAIASGHNTPAVYADVHVDNPAIGIYVKLEFANAGYAKESYMRLWRRFNREPN